MATTRKVPAATIAEIAGIKRQLHGQWAGKSMVRQPGNEGCDELDLIELTVLRSLMTELGPEEARIAWSQVRSHLKDRLPIGQFDVVYDSQRKLAQIASSNEDVAAAVRHGRPVRVLPMQELLTANREAFRRALDGVSRKRRPIRDRKQLRA